MRKKNRRNKINPCAICGAELRKLLIQEYPRTIRRFSIECGYCHACTKQYATEWGARRAWNKMTNIVSIKNQDEYDAAIDGLVENLKHELSPALGDHLTEVCFGREPRNARQQNEKGRL